MADFSAENETKKTNPENQPEAKQDEKPLIYRFTRDPKLIDEYITLRQQIYETDLGLGGLLGHRDEYDDDKETEVLVALDHGKVVGGGRMIISSPQRRILLHLENELLQLKDVLPEMNLEKEKYAEVCGIIVSNLYRSKTRCADNMFIIFNNRALVSGAKFIFHQAPRIVAKMYKLCCNRLGIYTEILKDIRVPHISQHGNLEEVLLSRVEVRNLPFNLLNGGVYEQ